MPKGYPSLNETQKSEIINRVTDKGERVPDLAREYGVIPKTIYNLLRNKANQSQAVLELAKLKRENEALISIIGSLVAENRLGKKRSKREVIVNYFSSADSSKESPAISKSAACNLKQQIEAVLLEHIPN